MSVATIEMVDTIHGDATHDDVDNIPDDTPAVAGYISGTNGVEWSSADFARFSKDKRFRIYQGYGPVRDIHGFDILDVETGAVTPVFAAELVKQRVDAGITWTTVYGSDSALAQVTAEIQKLGEHYWNGHVNYWLANWDLDQQHAAALVGTFVHGASCVGVQWASPSSNPHTLLPGTQLTLAQSNCDLSVIDVQWTPSGGFSPLPEPTPQPQPQPQPQPTLTGLLVTSVLLGTGSGFASREVHSSDGGKTWE